MKLNLQKRELYMLIGGLAIIGCIAVYLLGQGPLKEYERAQKRVEAARERLDRVTMLRDNVLLARSDQQAVVRAAQMRPAGFDLWSYINRAVGQTNLQANAKVESPRRSTSSGVAMSEVQLSLNGVSLEDLVDLLHLIYDGKSLVVVRKIDYLREARDSKGLDCRITFESPKL